MLRTANYGYPHHNIEDATNNATDCCIWNDAMHERDCDDDDDDATYIR